MESYPCEAIIVRCWLRRRSREAEESTGRVATGRAWFHRICYVCGVGMSVRTITYSRRTAVAPPMDRLHVGFIRRLKNARVGNCSQEASLLFGAFLYAPLDFPDADDSHALAL